MLPLRRKLSGSGDVFRPSISVFKDVVTCWRARLAAVSGLQINVPPTLKDHMPAVIR
jgi:hypothetical protein